MSNFIKHGEEAPNTSERFFYHIENAEKWQRTPYISWNIFYQKQLCAYIILLCAKRNKSNCRISIYCHSIKLIFYKTIKLLTKRETLSYIGNDDIFYVKCPGKYDKDCI